MEESGHRDRASRGLEGLAKTRLGELLNGVSCGTTDQRCPSFCREEKKRCPFIFSKDTLLPGMLRFCQLMTRKPAATR